MAQPGLADPRFTHFELLCRDGARDVVQRALTRRYPKWKVRAVEDPRGRELDVAPSPKPKDVWALAAELASLDAVVDVEPAFDFSFIAPPFERGPSSTRHGIVGGALASDWSANLVRAREAWAYAEQHGKASRGEGVLIGHPDSGYLEHPELPDGVRAELGDDFVNGPKKPPTIFNPDGSHGLSTVGVIASAERPAAVPGRQPVVGIAPLATIVPFRVSQSTGPIPSPVLFPEGANRLALALWQAVAKRLHVVSVSLGWFGTARMERALRDAVAADLIVVCAAGNGTGPLVVWPAHYPDAIAMAACDANQQPWFWSAFGRAVTATAPGHDVWVAVQGDAYSQPSSGTSHATATTAGIAALWLAHHGRAFLQGLNPTRRLQDVFRALLRATARPTPSLPKDCFGAGVVDALALLQANPRLPAAAHQPFAAAAPRPAAWLTDTFSGVPVDELDERLARDVGLRAARLDELAPLERRELTLLAVSEPSLRGALVGAPAGAGKRLTESDAWRARASTRLREALARLEGTRSEGARQPPPSPPPPPAAPSGGRVPPPHAASPRDRATVREYPRREWRYLRVFGFDPSLGRGLENEVLLRVPHETVAPGPVADRLAVVDYDPVAHRAYPPVDLEDPAVLSQDGLAPSVSDPRFHQQMVYAVARKTVLDFESSLGRQTRWAFNTKPNVSPRPLELFPHGLHSANAFYSRELGAVVFGSFRAESSERSTAGEVVHTCLSHDIIAHEVTHALVDGEKQFFSLDTNPDVPAFHEALADVVALLQKFRFTEATKAALRRTGGTLWQRQYTRRPEAQARGDAVGADRVVRNPLLELAGQFGVALGKRAALRSALGKVDPSPKDYELAREPHERGAILVAAIFDAYFTVFGRRNDDLLSQALLATRDGAPLPEWLTERLARSAASIAETFLRICVRALDYCPPVDVTFGDYLRALITSDGDFMPEDPWLFRHAFIDAFRVRGLVPRSVLSVAEDSLRWTPLDVRRSLAELGPLRDAMQGFLSSVRAVRVAEQQVGLWTSRRGVGPADAERLVEEARAAHRRRQRALARALNRNAGLLDSGFEGLATRTATFRALPRVDLFGQPKEGVVVELISSTPTRVPGPNGTDVRVKLAGGATVIFGEGLTPLYVIRRALSEQRREEQRDYLAAQWRRQGVAPALKRGLASLELDFRHIHGLDEDTHHEH